MYAFLRKIVLWTVGVILVLYALGCVGYYFTQERMIFRARALPAGGSWRFPGRFAEHFIVTPDGDRLDGLLFRADSSRGVIFFLHGNSENLGELGGIAHVYTDLNYDVFFLDYRGYGHSEGHISSERQLLADVQTAYDSVRTWYHEDSVVVLGYSIGTGPATWVAARNHPRQLILQAPYYSIRDLAAHYVPSWLAFSFPTFLLKYPLRTYTYLPRVRAPVVIFHGDSDRVIPLSHSYKLKPLLKPGDRLILLHGQGHSGFTENPVYRDSLASVL